MTVNNDLWLGYDWWYYCEYYSSFNTYYCTDDFDQNDDWENSLSWTHYYDETSPNMGMKQNLIPAISQHRQDSISN